MSQAKLSERELLILIEASCDSTLASSDLKRLESALWSDATARELYQVYMLLDADLYWRAVEIADAFRWSPGRSAAGLEADGMDSPLDHKIPLDVAFASFPAGFISDNIGPLDVCSAGPSCGFCGGRRRQDDDYRARSHSFGGRAANVVGQIRGFFAKLSLGMALLVMGGTGLFWAALFVALSPFMQSKDASLPRAANVSVSPQHRPVAANVDSFAATLMAMADCQWQIETGEATPGLGTSFSPGSVLALSSGVVQLRFANGAAVHLEGPVRFIVRSPQQGLLEQGKLLVQVPRRATGFRITTPTVEVIDLGTEFGVQTDAQGASHVQVFRGLVEVENSSEMHRGSTISQRLRLLEGQSVRGDAAGLGSIARTSVTSDQFFPRLAQAPQPAHDRTESEVAVDFSADPGWRGEGNINDGNHYGFSPGTAVAGGAAGEVGGKFVRSKTKDHYYGDTHLSRTLSLNDALKASGKFDVSNLQGWDAGGDSRIFIGFFSSSTEANRREYLGIGLREGSGKGTFCVKADVAGLDGNFLTSDELELPVDGNYSFSFVYEPNVDLTRFPGSDGRLVLTVSGPNIATKTLELNDIGMQKRVSGASFDAFGMGVLPEFGSADDRDLHVDVFIDDVSYSGFVRPARVSRSQRLDLKRREFGRRIGLQAFSERMGFPGRSNARSLALVSSTPVIFFGEDL